LYEEREQLSLFVFGYLSLNNDFDGHNYPSFPVDNILVSEYCQSNLTKEVAAIPMMVSTTADPTEESPFSRLSEGWRPLKRDPAVLHEQGLNVIIRMTERDGFFLHEKWACDRKF
jgi:hypothetical protein